MNQIHKVEKIARNSSLNWLRKSLSLGFDVAEAVSNAEPFASGCFQTIVPDDFNLDQVDFAVGGVVHSKAAEDCLGRLLDSVTSHSVTFCLLIENDLLGRADPVAEDHPGPCAFIGERVVHWCDLGPELGTAGVEAIRDGSSGYPLNAFLVSRSSKELGLIDRQVAPFDLGQRVAGSLEAIIVSAFDAESFLIWSHSSLTPS